MLNALWLAFFVIASIAGLFQWLILHDAQVFTRIVQSPFDMASLSVSLMILLFGTLTLWLGFLRAADSAGPADWLGRARPRLVRRLMPGVPAGPRAIGLITLNSAADGLRLDTAAPRSGLRAMRELQTLNPGA